MSALSGKAIIGIGLGVCAAVVGYCIYFDHKRHADPDFKRKLKEKRRKNRQKKLEGSRSRNPIPADMNNPSQMQAFFLQEIQLGEELLAEGEFEEAVEHLGNAVVMCGQPQQLLQILQQTLPPQAFTLLMDKLSSMRTASGADDISIRPAVLQEQDLE